MMKYKIPDENTPGFLRREIKRQAFLEAEEGVGKTKAMIDWLSEYIDEPDPRKALANASSAEIAKLINEVTGVELPDPKESGATGDG